MPGRVSAELEPMHVADAELTARRPHERLSPKSAYAPRMSETQRILPWVVSMTSIRLDMRPAGPLAVEATAPFVGPFAGAAIVVVRVTSDGV